MYEFAAASGVSVHPNGVALCVPDSQSPPSSGSGNGAGAAERSSSSSNGGSRSGAPAAEPEQGQITGRLLIDCMGNFSPIVRQARWGQRPDGVCLVVGSCCRGFTNNSTGVPHCCSPSFACTVPCRGCQPCLPMAHCATLGGCCKFVRCWFLLWCRRCHFYQHSHAWQGVASAEPSAILGGIPLGQRADRQDHLHVHLH